VTNDTDAAAGPSKDPGADELTQALLAATIEVFGERGYEGARVADIAARAGVTTGAVYTRFTGKAELLTAAFEQESSDLLQTLAASNVPAFDILANLGSDILVRDQKLAGMMLESFAASRREPELAERLRPRLADERNHLAKLVDEEKTNGVIDESLDTESIAVFVQAVGIGVQLLRLIEVKMPDAAKWDHLLLRLIASLVTAADDEAEATS